MQCLFCGGVQVYWRNELRPNAYTFCPECKRKNCERTDTRVLPHGLRECTRAQLPLRIT